jgi:hypothetical protein
VARHGVPLAALLAQAAPRAGGRSPVGGDRASSELPRATKTASEDSYPVTPRDNDASLRVPSRWTTTVQARAR